MGSFKNGSFLALDEDQPRDEDGKFASTGSGGGGGKSSHEEHIKAFEGATSYGDVEKIVNERTKGMSNAELNELAQKYAHLPAGRKHTNASLREHLAKSWLQNKRFQNKIKRDEEAEKKQEEFRNNFAKQAGTKIL